MCVRTLWRKKLQTQLGKGFFGHYGHRWERGCDSNSRSMMVTQTTAPRRGDGRSSERDTLRSSHEVSLSQVTQTCGDVTALASDRKDVRHRDL